MVQNNDVFSKRITIDGVNVPIIFTFRMLHGAYRIDYKIRTNTPHSDFNMHSFTVGESTTFVFSDKSILPAWLYKDKCLQTKLNKAIASTF